MNHTSEPVFRLVIRNGVNAPCENSLSLLSLRGNKSEEDKGNCHTEPAYVSTCPHVFTSRSVEMGYMNLNSSQNY